MMIPEEILHQYNCQLIEYEKDEYIFHEESPAIFYTQVVKGLVKMATYSLEGKEFIQGIFKSGESFGEPALFGGFNYPSNAIALEKCSVLKLNKEDFIELLRNNFQIHLKFDNVLSNRLNYKSMLLKEMSSYCPEHVILTILRYFRDKNLQEKSFDIYEVPFTRQQIADMTGLRVETVIRNVKKLEKQGKLQLKNHKILLPAE